MPYKLVLASSFKKAYAKLGKKEQAIMLHYSVGVQEDRNLC